MIRRILFTIVSLVLSSIGLAHASAPQCFPGPAGMPERWRPPAELQKTLDPAPWSPSEAADARSAIDAGVDEMIGYFKRKPSAIQSLGDDAIEALIQVTYASANTSDFDTRVRDAARYNLTALITPYLDRDPKSATCDEFDRLFPLALFAHKLYPAKNWRTDIVTKSSNAAFQDCDSLEDAVGHDFQKLLDDTGAPLEDLFDLYIWSLWFIEAELYPDIVLPSETRKFAPAVWKYFRDYRLAAASEFETGARDKEFIGIADLATHIVHIPTGTHRFPLYVEDAPDLYRFHRENFYAVLQSGDLDLFASFVDSLRQYGCNAENDAQVRDGSRYLLKVFHDNNGRWMDYRGDGKTDHDLNDYDLVHRPWTAILGLRVRRLEQPDHDTYGGIVRRWLPNPR